MNGLRGQGQVPAQDPTPAPQQSPTVLTPQRLAQVLASRGWRLRDTGDGALLGRFGEVVVRVSATGGTSPVLNVLGLMPSPVPAHLRKRLREAVDEVHRAEPWPTCFVAPQEDGGLVVGGACALGLAAGVTDAQVLAHVESSVAACTRAFERVRTALDGSGSSL